MWCVFRPSCFRVTQIYAAADNLIKIWSPFTGELIRNLSGHTKGLSDISWSSEGTYLASASDDTSIRIWNIETVRSSLPFVYNLSNMSLGIDNKTSAGTYELRILSQLQYCIDPISIRWMRRRRAYLEHCSRCIAMRSFPRVQGAYVFRKMHQNAQCPSRLRHRCALQPRRIADCDMLP